MSRTPLVVNEELAHSAAFVAAWLPGSEGAAVAVALFGGEEFRGRLAFAWPAGMEGGTAVAREGEARFGQGYWLRAGTGSGRKSSPYRRWVSAASGRQVVCVPELTPTTAVVGW
ncbi:MAG: glycoside hydrolase family 3 C-terminal domain-containing protein [Gemmatimonadota bacterium]